MYKLAYAFANVQEESVQEAAYLCLSSLWLRKLFSSFLYLYTNSPNPRVRIIQTGLENFSTTST